MKGTSTGDRQRAAQSFRDRGKLSEPGMVSVGKRQGGQWDGHREQDSRDIKVLISICPTDQKVE